MKICIVAGARPNFMKIAPIIDSIKQYNNNNKRKIAYKLVHTGQHYDEIMSKLFFVNLGIPTPDVDLEVGSATHAIQTAEIMKKFEKVCIKEKPTHILVVGDVNSTIACALVASKLQIKVIHVEAGLRSFDRTMPEEINRLLTDAISDYLFITEESALSNLKKEGIKEGKIHFVGNVMIDTLLKHKRKAENSLIQKKLGLINSKNDSKINYAVLTLHRPSNVDEKDNLRKILDAIKEISSHLPIIFPIHPRTLSRIKEFEFEKLFNWDNYLLVNSLKIVNDIFPIQPLGYLDFLNLTANSKLVLTDSGGIQEETTILGVPCVTIRENTERPVTIHKGTNVLTGNIKVAIVNTAMTQMEKYQNSTQGLIPPPLWDGKAAERIVKILSSELT